MPAIHAPCSTCALARSWAIEGGSGSTTWLRVFSTTPGSSKTNRRGNPGRALPALRRDPVRDLERHGNDGEGRVVARGGGEDAPVAGVEVVDVVEAAPRVRDRRRRVGAHAQRPHDVARARRRALLLVGRRHEDLVRRRARVPDDLLHEWQVEHAGRHLVGVGLGGDAGRREPVHVPVGRIEVDQVRALRRILGLHRGAEGVLADAAVAEAVLERQAHAGAETAEGGELDRVHGAVLADRLALRGAELADAAQEDARLAAHGEETDVLAAGLDAAEGRESVRACAPALAVYAPGEEAVHVRQGVEHEVLPELAARVAEHGPAWRG